MAQIVEGYQRQLKNLRRYFRAEVNSGAVDDQTCADGLWEGTSYIIDLIIESGIYWSQRKQTIDDTNLGTEIDFQVHELFIKKDLGITDMAKITRLWRVDPNKKLVRGRIPYVIDDRSGHLLRDPGSLVGPAGEFYSESSDVTSDGNQEQSILLYNKGTALEGGHLHIEYWWSPPPLTVEDLYETDANGNFTKGPSVPEKMWVHILNYAKWVIAEQTGDIDKQEALARRFGGSDGIKNRVREFLGEFQTGDPRYVHDQYGAEVI